MEFETNPVELENPAEVKAPENVVLGLIGALIGAVIGGASIIILSQLGYVASISGVILAFCTLKGYELLGKGMSRKGIVICVVLVIVTPFVADWIDWALLLMDAWSAYGVTFADALTYLPELMADGTIPMADYLKNLGMIYLFVALGGFYYFKNALKKQK